MRALHNIHNTLRPGGLLLDIHPEPRHPQVVARIDAHTTPVGHLDESYRIGTVLAACAALRDGMDAGLFAREREITFIFTYHFASVEAWLGYMAKSWSSAGVSADVIERARELLATEDVELRIPREIHASRLRKLGA